MLHEIYKWLALFHLSGNCLKFFIMIEQEQVPGGFMAPITFTFKSHFNVVVLYTVNLNSFYDTLYSCFFTTKFKKSVLVMWQFVKKCNWIFFFLEPINCAYLILYDENAPQNLVSLSYPQLSLKGLSEWCSPAEKWKQYPSHNLTL